MCQLEIVQTAGWYGENSISYWNDEFSIEHFNEMFGWNWHRFYTLGYSFVPYDEDPDCVFALACSLD